MVAGHSASGAWDIFCRVVDNFGDAGVCWRLARILRHEHDVPVRLWIDDLQTLQALYPALDPGLPRQSCEGITVCRWPQAGLPDADAAVVIEAFGCGLPEEWIAGMAQAAKPPLWIILEYLSAEDWVDSHHGLSSPHPQLSLPRYFFFPGFTTATGGLPRESGLLSRRDGFGTAARQAFWSELGFAPPQAPAVSLFAYADAPLAGLLSAMAADTRPLVLAVPEGALLSAVRGWLGSEAVAGRGPWRRGTLEVRALPFLPQARYDELLWACDFNFVRGEDSFVRAQWAGRPLVWQPYRQEDDAHQRKMAAFLARYCADLAAPAATALQAFWRDWNAATDPAGSWPALRDVADDLARHALRWSAKLADSGELAAQLVEFSRRKVK